MRHPSPGGLLELHFEETAGAEREALDLHVRACPRCASLLADVRAVEQALSPREDDAPPPDGLQRVLARVEHLEPARARRAAWARVALPSAAALAAGAWAVRAGAERLASAGLVPASPIGPLSGDLLGLALAALGVLAAGAAVTLALAPILILEAHGRS
jgi:hypothetical protein